MKKYIELTSKISSSGGTSTSFKTTIPKVILNKMEVTSGDLITWRVYDNNNKVEIIFKDPIEEKKSKEETKKENYKKYIKGSKNKGYYIVNKEKNINIGAYINKETAKDNIDILIKDKWNKETIDIAKLNIELEITEERFPHVRNNKPYFSLTDENYNNLYKDTEESTPFKNISYEELQKIIKNSINETSNIHETSKKKILSTTETNNKELIINTQLNPYKQIAVYNIKTDKQITTLGITKRQDEEVKEIISKLKKGKTEEEMKSILEPYRENKD